MHKHVIAFRIARLFKLTLNVAFATFITACSAMAPQDFDVTEASILDIQRAMTDGRVTAEELVAKYLQRIAAYDKQGPALNALLLINPRAAEQARALDEERRESGPRSLLHGIPVIVKDNYNTTDMPTTGASRALANFIPSDNAAQIDLLLNAGAVVLAKANLHEFAYGITTISSLGGQTRNPYNTDHFPGGSSGGTAAAIAASFASFGMGSDTCGSIRIPAAYNNLVGLRPSKGLSSIFGIMPLSSTQDVAGPLARSVEDLAIVLDLLAGYDPRDAATRLMQNQPAQNFQAQLESGTFGGVRIGRLDAYFAAAEPEVLDLLDEALNRMQQLGAEIVDVSIPEMSRLVAESGLIGHEFEADLNAYLQQFGSTEFTSLEAIVAAELHHEALDGLLTRSAAAEQDTERYQAAKAKRVDLQDAIAAVMQSHNLDVIAYPPIASLPARIGTGQPGNNCSLSGNSGLPAISIPVGFSAAGLPMGIELLGPQLSDSQLVAMAFAYEQAFQVRRAPASVPPIHDRN